MGGGGGGGGCWFFFWIWGGGVQVLSQVLGVYHKGKPHAGAGMFGRAAWFGILDFCPVSCKF